MKVNVLTIDDVEIGRFSWWSKWIDVAVFDYTSTPFLLQMRVSRTNAKKFKAIRMTGKYIYRQATTTCIGNLVQMEVSDGK